MSSIHFDTIDEAIKDILQGKMIIVVDDEDRENEGDFVIAARFATPEVVNFMATVGKGLICVPLEEARCDALDLGLMVQQNSAQFQTQFTVSVDFLGDGCTTGISAYDRSRTIKALIDPETKPEDLGRPGHIFPLRAKEDGVLRRAGHTEAAIDLARLAGLEPAGVIVEIMNDNGTMARLPDLSKIAQQYQLRLITIQDLISYRLRTESLVTREVSVSLPTKYGDFQLTAYTHKHTGQEHLAIHKGKWTSEDPVLTRVHSSCFTGDILGSLRCDCGDQLTAAMQQIEKHGSGVVLYMNQEGRGIGLINKLKAYHLQEKGLNTVQANIELGFRPDERDYGIGAQILRDLGIRKLRLMTNNPTKRAGLQGYGLEIVDTVPLECTPNIHNHNYLRTKKELMGHEILLEE